MSNKGILMRGSASVPEDDRAQRRRIRVHDCRYSNESRTEKRLDASGLDFSDFRQVLQQKFAIDSDEFVLATPDGTVVDFDKFEELEDGSILKLFQQKDQASSVATKEHITFVPHYDTLIRGGMYEYYSSREQNALPFALAELIDNALSATAKNKDARTIEMRMMFDETLGKPAVIVIDNGYGMTTKQLKEWAVYRLSKFNRKNSEFASEQEGYVRPKPVRRSLNSDISYFGVGGKQAVFFIGDSVRMISQPVGSPLVHELALSKEDFERKERNNEEIYSGIITNRKPCDSSHVTKDDERFLHALIAEETEKESFTAVVITGVLPDHITFLAQDFEVWTRQLAHIYHYYIHGVNGNDGRSASTDLNHSPKIDIQITLREKPPKCPCVMSLHEVGDDIETLFIQAAADTFEFMATTEDRGTVEGVIRYHPFLFDRETYPEVSNAVQDSDNDVKDDDDDCDSETRVLHQARGKRPIFDCFWNGRLIPYTKVSELVWCTWNKEAKLPVECYSRISGVLFTDDRFQVTTNKLTFMDLELKLKDKNTIFTRIVDGQRQRTDIKKVFTQWLQSCHEKLDKQIQFLGYGNTITRADVPNKKKQHPWGTFSSIKWGDKMYKAGQLVKSRKTNPILYGKVQQFLLYGNYSGAVFATGGEVELTLEPRELYDKTKTIPISKIDLSATEEAIDRHIVNEKAKFPEKLKVDWPEGNPWPQNANRPAGTPLGKSCIVCPSHQFT